MRIYPVKNYKEIEHVHETGINPQLMYEIYGIKNSSYCC